MYKHWKSQYQKNLPVVSPGESKPTMKKNGSTKHRDDITRYGIWDIVDKRINKAFTL